MYLPEQYVAKYRICERVEEHLLHLLGSKMKVVCENPVNKALAGKGTVGSEYYDGLYLHAHSPQMISGGFSLCKYETNCGMVLGSRLGGTGRTPEESALLKTHMFRWAMRVAVEFGFSVFTWSLNHTQILCRDVLLAHGMKPLFEDKNRRSGNTIILYGRTLPPVGDPAWVEWGLEKPPAVAVAVATEGVTNVPVGNEPAPVPQAVVGAVPAEAAAI